MNRVAVGPILREWRMQRRLSQLDLAVEAGVSARHLSFVETGRAKPSPEMVLLLAAKLDVPLRERNSLLLAAGYAPRFAETAIDAPEMAQMRSALQAVLDATDPFPAIVVDRRWDVLMSNRAAAALTHGVDESLLSNGINVFRVSLHPKGMATRVVNFPEWAAHLLGQLRRLAANSRAPEIDALLSEVLAYPNVAALDLRDEDVGRTRLVLPLILRSGAHELSLFTTMTTFGSPLDEIGRAHV